MPQQEDYSKGGCFGSFLYGLSHYPFIKETQNMELGCEGTGPPFHRYGPDPTRGKISHCQFFAGSVADCYVMDLAKHYSTGLSTFIHGRTHPIFYTKSHVSPMHAGCPSTRPLNLLHIIAFQRIYIPPFCTFKWVHVDCQATKSERCPCSTNIAYFKPATFKPSELVPNHSANRELYQRQCHSPLVFSLSATGAKPLYPLSPFMFSGRRMQFSIFR